MRALLDTNVLASGLVGLTQQTNSPLPRLLNRWTQGSFTLLTSEFVLGELADVLQRPYFARQISPDDRKRILTTLQTDAEVVVPHIAVLGIAKHRQDDLVLSAAVSGKADYLVTGDAQFLRVGEYEGVKLRTPAEFLRELDARRP